MAVRNRDLISIRYCGSYETNNLCVLPKTIDYDEACALFGWSF